jgi:hypothetical protein
MSTFNLHPTLSALAAAAAILSMPTLALAKQPGAQEPLTGVSSSSFATSATAAVDYMFDVSGIFSFDGLGNAMNEVHTIAVGPNTRVVGIGWDVAIFADDPSFLSEMAISVGSSSSSAFNLRVGVGDDAPGTMSYNSGGIVDLVGLSLDFSVNANGTLRMEFYEDFDDFPGDSDGRWVSGTLTISTMPIPEPGTYGMMALGLAAIGVMARRRKV